MEKKYSVNDFVTLAAKKRVTAESSPAQQVNIYEWLRAQGFGQSTINGKTIYFRLVNGTIKPSSVIAMRYEFLKFLETCAFINWPEGITRHDLLEWYYATMPPKRNQLFKEYLFSELSEDEIHQYRMEDDSHYRHRYGVDQLISQLNAWGFKKAIDLKSSFSKDADLYYKSVGNGQFLVFNHYNKDGKDSSDGLDCWLAPFKSEAQIGKILNPHARDIRLSFQLNRDLDLIKQHVS
jgi:hypothetical protein